MRTGRAFAGLGAALLLAAGAAAGSTVNAPQGSESATEIVRRADAKTRGRSSYTEMTMRIVRPEWTRTLRMKAWTLGDDYALVLVTAPAAERGSASLKRGREMWNWVPRIERVIRIAPSMLGQAWMGSDFTNDDLVNQSSLVVDYSHRLLREEPLDGVPCWVIEATARPEAPVVWSRLLLWISQGEYNERRVEYYDEAGERVATLTTAGVREIGGRRLPTRLTMRRSAEPGRYTEIIEHAARFDFPIEESFFSLARLRELRP